MISQGVSMILVEQLFKKSDPFTIPVCKQCGQIPNNRETCNMCGHDEFHEVNTPFANKLLNLNLGAMNIKTSLFVKND